MTFFCFKMKKCHIFLFGPFLKTTLYKNDCFTKKCIVMLAKRTNLPVFTNFFDDFFQDWSTTNFSSINTTLPQVNIVENESYFMLEVAAPGMDKKDFKIDLDNDTLTVSSEKTTNDDVSEENYTRKEYSYMSFERSFSLPKGIIDKDKIEANYINGELKISIPKLEEAKPKPIKLITVK